MTPTIAYVHLTPAVTDSQVNAYLAAQKIQIMRDFLPAWGKIAGLEGVNPIYCAPGQMIPGGAWQIWFVGKSTQLGDLGWHDDSGPGGLPKGYVAVEDDLASGNSWTGTGSHETLEVLLDPWLNATIVIGPRTYLREACDPCEADGSGYRINGLSMSDFVLPSYWVPGSKGPWSFNNTLRGPLTLGPEGYQLVRDGAGPFRQDIEAGRQGCRWNKADRPDSRTMRAIAGRAAEPPSRAGRGASTGNCM